MISITDEGIGIPERLLPRIFDPYFTTKQSGSGLGLATSYSIVKKHEGHIDVTSVPHKETTFTVYLPASAAPAAQEGKSSVEVKTGSGRVLLMDDEEYILDLASRVLTRYGYDVACVGHGEEAVETYRQALTDGQPFDLVVLDLTIPGGMGGLETIEKLRDLDPDVLAIVCSGYSNDPVMSRHREFGFASVVTKPYRPQELLAAVSAVLAPPSKAEETK